LAFGFWLLAFGFWLLAFGFWLLAFGFWLLAFGFWLLQTDMPLAHKYMRVNDIQMHYVTAGQGSLVLLLHGFPEFWYSWRYQIPVLAEQFTVVAPDLRGYNETDKPAWGYEPDVLAADVVALIDALGQRDAHLVGHDWGGMIAWLVAISYPQRVRKLAILNAPHPARFAEHLASSPRQLLRSWYMGFFQLPLLPEALLRANDYAAIEQALRGSAVNKQAFSDEDIAAYKDAISKPGALRAALTYYRRLPSLLGRRFGNVDAPTLLIWGEQDLALDPALVGGTERYVPNLQVRRIPESGHWVQQEASQKVNQYLLEFLR
jgi:pimeloyl-ACP methyl ester carboxylesterase